MTKIFLSILIMLVLSSSLIAQIGGKNTYKFLAIPNSARAEMMGGSYNSIYDNDVSLSVQNPATLNPAMTKNMSLNYSAYYGGITYGNFNYVHDFKPATFQFGATFVNYGRLREYDVFGVDQGELFSNEIALNVGAGKSYKDKYKFGANAKLIYSQLANYSSVGMAFDLAAMWTDTAHLINMSFNVTNLGFQFKTYRKGKQEVLPVDVQLSFSKRLKHVPFRFIVTAHHLYTWDIRYDNPNSNKPNTNLFNEEEKEKNGAVKVIDNIGKHLTFGTEFYIGKIITLGIAYNHLRRSEMVTPDAKGMAGFSFGFGLKINRFQFQYAFAKYGLPQSVNHLTLNVNLGQRIKIKKRKVKELQ